jgi:hypothetical protein
MLISPIAAGLLWAWLLLFAPASGLSDRLADDPFMSSLPRSVRYEFQASLQGLDENFEASGKGAYLQPDRLQLAIDTEGQQYEMVAIGQTFYYRGTGDRDWVQQTLEPGRGPLAITPSDPSAVSPEIAELVAEMQRGFRLEGTETRNGEPVRRFRGEFDLLTLADRLGGEASMLRDQVERLVFSVEFWIGAQNNYLYGLNINADARTRAPIVPGGSTAVTGNFELRLFDQNQPLAIEPPVGSTAQPPLPSPTQPPTPSPTPRPAPVQAPAQIPRGGR